MNNEVNKINISEACNFLISRKMHLILRGPLISLERFLYVIR